MTKFRCLYISRYAPNRTRTDPYTGLPWYLSERTNLIGLWGKGSKPAPFSENCERILATNPSWWGMPKCFFAILKFMKEGHRLDEIVCGIDEYSLTVGLFVGKATRVPVFCVVEDPPFTDRYGSPISWIRRQEKRVRQLILERLLKQCSGIFCFIERDVLIDFNLPDVPVYQLMNGVSPETLQWVQKQSRREEKSSECVIGYVGAINRKQGIDDLLEIFAVARQKATNLRLRLIGPMENGYAESYHNKICDLALNSEVEITGWLPYEKMLEKLLECDICVHCNPPTEWFRSAQPLKVCEYLALGKPTIAWDYPGVRRMLSHGRYGMLVPPGKKPAFVEALISLQDSRTRDTIRDQIEVGLRGDLSSEYWYGHVLEVLDLNARRKQGP